METGEDIPEIDDLFRHRLRLACIAMAEVRLPVRDRLRHWVQRLTAEMYRASDQFFLRAKGDVEWEYWRFRPAAMDYLKSATEAIGFLNGYVGARHLMDFLRQRLHELIHGTPFEDAARWIQLASPPAMDEEIIRVLLMPFDGNLQTHVHEWVVLAIINLGTAATDQVMGFLLAAASEPVVLTSSSYARMAAALALGDVGTAAATEDVAKTLRGVAIESHWEVSPYAAKSLCQLGEFEPTDDMQNALICALEKGKTSAARVLAEFRDDAASSKVIQGLS